jgi:hypothetical protein
MQDAVPSFLMQPQLPTPSARAAGPFARMIDAYNPGITMLVSIWLAALSLRRYLQHAGDLSQTGYEALTSLIYVVPVMLVGWALLAASERFLGLRPFGGGDK